MQRLDPRAAGRIAGTTREDMPMRRLILMRHGKSSWDDPDQADHDRPLDERGRLASTLMGAWISERGLMPDAVLVSDAVRARETLEALSLDDGVKVKKRPKLYHADPPAILDVLRGAPKAETVLAIGHEPGLGLFLRKVVSGEPRAGCRRAFEKFPTAAIAVLEFDAEDWGSVDFGGASFTQFVRPKDLV